MKATVNITGTSNDGTNLIIGVAVQSLIDSTNFTANVTVPLTDNATKAITDFEAGVITLCGEVGMTVTSTDLVTIGGLS